MSVSNTQIFARISSRGTQFLAYQMDYESLADNAMILPIPVNKPVRDDSLRFIDLYDYPDLFDDLDSGFPYKAPVTFSIGCSAARHLMSRQNLQVFEVGNYIASFVPNLVDFSRLDPRFTLPQTVWSRLPQYQDYGFAVFQLAAGSLKPHPMAFEFQRAGDSVYFPTMHIHDGVVHDTEEFDHVLYLQHAGFDSRVYGYDNSDVIDESTGLVRSKYIAKRFCSIARSAGIIQSDLLVHRRVIRGNHPNSDTWLSTAGDPENPTLNLRPWLSYVPWLLTSGAVFWLFARRYRLKKMRIADQPTAQS
ncbi:MAG: hypothetical protein JSS27_03420 [Planctomycetes bacterium]|nr:hypothetical protein [Planctomycetota bacterium]